MKNLYLISFVLILFALGCKLPSFLQRGDSNAPAANTSSTSPTSRTEHADTAPTSDARSDVIRASKKFLDRPSFSAVMTGQGKTPMQIELSYEQPDRFHMINQAGPAGRIETIIIGRDMYMKAGERWQKMPGALGKSVPQIREFFDEEGLKSLTNVKYIGEASVGGHDTYVYSYRNEADDDMTPYPFTSKIWVRATDGLPAKIEVDYDGGDLTRMSIVYDYEKAVSIKPPMN